MALVAFLKLGHRLHAVTTPISRPWRLGWTRGLQAFSLARWLVLWLVLFGPLSPWARAQDGVQAVPALSARVMDRTGTLSAAERQALDDKLAAFERERGTQIVVLMVPTTLPEDVASYAQRVGAAWKIGRREVGDGLLIVVAKNDRRVNIQTAKALEGAVPDVIAGRIITDVFRPAFRANNYAGGLNAAVDQLTARIKGENLALPKLEEPGWQEGGGGGEAVLGGLLPMAMFFFIGVPIIGSVLTSMMGRKLGSVATGAVSGGAAWLVTASMALAVGAGLAALLLVGLFGIGAAGRSVARRTRRSGPPIIWGGGGGGNWGGGGWGGGSGGGGGFSSGGGGDFGGGGASGDW